ncbi:unnamed protein product [Amoebophrya sp. A25]|nr:unnamed protein product [Amoebophrya sp. A25]|eukprot:GSA25T00017966001.1
MLFKASERSRRSSLMLSFFLTCRVQIERQGAKIQRQDKATSGGLYNARKIRSSITISSGIYKNTQCHRSIEF